MPKRRHLTSEFDSYFIPASSDQWSERPQITVVLHGRGDSLKPFKAFDEELGLPEMNYLLLNAPRRYDGGYTWYAFPPRQALGVLKAREKLIRLVAELQNRGYESRDIYFLGFSQGCLVSGDLVMNTNLDLGGVVGVSGYLYFFSHWQRRLEARLSEDSQTPWLMTHGRRDEALAIEETEAHVEKIQALGYPLQWREYDKDHEFIEPELEDIARWLKAKGDARQPGSAARLNESLTDLNPGHRPPQGSRRPEVDISPGQL